MRGSLTCIYLIKEIEFLDNTRLRAVLFFLFILVCLLIIQRITRIKFRDGQLDCPRVREAASEKEPVLKGLFKSNDIKYPPRSIFIRVFKEEKIVELWVSSKKSEPFVHITDYDMSCLSGDLGPKREEGDKQVPEGFYYIDRFNPFSKYYLSLGINYPNESDNVLGVRRKLGGDIFIHGGEKTVGCIPITDDKIKELYIAAIQAVSNGQDRIPVHIFPKKLDGIGIEELKQRFEGRKDLLSFWENLKEGYDIFERTYMIPKMTIGSDGKYIFRKDKNEF